MCTMCTIFQPVSKLPLKTNKCVHLAAGQPTSLQCGETPDAVNVQQMKLLFGQQLQSSAKWECGRQLNP